jgi:hypothetical protein
MKSRFGREKLALNNRNKLYLLYPAMPYRAIKLVSKILGKK